MRRVLTFPLLVLACVESTMFVPALTAQTTRPAQEQTWSGYLFKDAKGRLQIGWPVVAMGVMETAAHVVEGPLVPKIADLACAATDNWTFLNYELERPESQPSARIPRFLVKLRGIEVGDSDESDSNVVTFPPAGDRHLTNARLVEVEWVPPRWYELWSVFFRDLRSPFRIDLKRPQPTDDDLKAFAPVALSTLREMAKVPGPDAARVARLREIDPAARLVESWRLDKQWGISRWLREIATKHDIKLEGLETLPAPPPSATEIQRWFLDAATRAAFLKTVAEHWKGPADGLQLVYYLEHGRSTTWSQVDLVDVRDTWTDAEFTRNQKTTAQTIGR